MVPDAPLNTINTHISETLAMIDSPLAHDFSNRAGKQQRDLLRDKVRNLGTEITRNAYQQVKDSVKTLDKKIQSFDEEIRKKSIPNLFIRIIFFWKTFKPEKDIPLVSSVMMTARKEEDEKVVSLIKDMPQMSDAALFKEIEKIHEPANKLRLLMKAGAQDRPALFAPIVEALGSLTNLTQAQLRQRDRMISVLRERLEL